MAQVTARQRRLIEALLAGQSVTQACRTAGVGRRTYYRWLRQPAFREALAEAEADLLEAATRRLLALQASALDAVGAVLADEHLPPTYRLQAARLVLDSALRFYDATSLERRLRALEEEVRRVAAQGGAPE
jgi:hypothetical protein